MFQRLRESLSLVLIAVLPMHAMLVTVSTHILEGQNHAPLTILALWKEALLAVLMLIAVIEILRTKEPELRKSIRRFDLLDWCIILGLLLGIAVSFTRDVGMTRFFFGFKYDFLPLVAFLLLRRVMWSRQFLVSASRTIIMVGVIAAAYGIATLFLPLSFFTSIGYSDLHSLYRPDSAIASFQFLEGSEIRRIQSFMSGPNQFGLWLLLPFAANLQLFLKSFREHRHAEGVMYVLCTLLILGALFFTYSRSAWIGAAVILFVTAFLLVKHILRSVLQRTLVLVSGSAVIVILLAFGAIVSPQILVRAESLRGHIEKPLEALQIMRTHPFGLGLGTAGPASNRLSDTCVFLNSGADASWAASHQDLCVFIGGVQKQPVGKACACPLLTENWYLQWGVEMGFLGLLLSLAIIALALVQGFRRSFSEVHRIPVLALLGVAVGGIFLHSFEDAAVAYTVWVLMTAVLSGANILSPNVRPEDGYRRD